MAGINLTDNLARLEAFSYRTVRDMPKGRKERGEKEGQEGNQNRVFSDQRERENVLFPFFARESSNSHTRTIYGGGAFGVPNHPRD